MSFDELGAEIHAWARGKGFYDRERTAIGGGAFETNPCLPSEKLLLIVSEVSEVLDARRDGDEAAEEEEVADVLIRVLDYAAWRGFSMDRAVAAKMEKNLGRPHLHGRTF